MPPRVTLRLDDVESTGPHPDLVAIAQEEIHFGFGRAEARETVARRLVVDDSGIVIPELRPLSVE